MNLRLHAEARTQEGIGAIGFALSSLLIPYSFYIEEARKFDVFAGLFSIDGSDNIGNFTKQVGIELSGAGPDTNFSVSSQGQFPYRCERGDDFRYPRECVTIWAENDHAAALRCAMEAWQRFWLSGEPFPGHCS